MGVYPYHQSSTLFGALFMVLAPFWVVCYNTPMIGQGIITLIETFFLLNTKVGKEPSGSGSRLNAPSDTLDTFPDEFGIFTQELGYDSSDL